MLISFVIPCYRSEKTITGVINEITTVMNLRREHDFEIVCVNDCSPDEVLGVLKNIADIDSRLKVINFARNFGKASAVLAGLKYTSGNVIVSLDDDGQCPVDKTWDLIDSLDARFDIANANYPIKVESAFKRFGSKVNNSIMRFLIDQPDDIVMNNFFAMKRFVAEEMIKYANPYPALHPLILQASHNIKMVTMEERERADNNSSGFTFWKSFKLMINGFTNFSVRPLRFASVGGMGVAVVGFIYAVVVVVNRIINPAIASGYPSIMAALLMIGGSIMVLLGIIGEYLGRLYICINNAPQYVVKEIINL